MSENQRRGHAMARSQREPSFIAVGLSAILLLAGCYAKERDDAVAATLACTAKATATAKERDDALAKVDAFKTQLDTCASNLTAARTTPGARIAEVIKHKTEHWTDIDGLRTVVKDFTTLVEEFGNQPVGQQAKQGALKTTQQIAALQASLRRSQAEIVRLIQVCHREAQVAEDIQNGSFHFTGWGQDQGIDMNSALAGGREADRHRKTSTAAQSRATELLAGVEDPGGKLQERINGCDGTD